MNNSKIALDVLEEKPEVDLTPWQRQRMTELAETIEAIQAISGSSYWKILEKNLWGGLLQSIDRKLRDEKDEKEVYRLQGQAVWAQKYCDFGALAEVFRKELVNIKNKLDS